MAREKRKRKESTSSNSSSAQSGNSDTQASISRKSSSSASRTRIRSEHQRNQVCSESHRVAREASSETILRQSLANLQTYIDNKFASLTSTITLDATEYVSKQQKYCAYDFKFKGNKDQFNLNQELIDSLQETLVAPQVDIFLKVVQSTIDSLKTGIN